jgi:hypothetical protein
VCSRILKASLAIPAEGATTTRDYRFLTLALLGIVLAFAISYASYFVQSLSEFNSLYALGSLIFWIAILALVFRFALSSVARSFASYARSRSGIAIFAAYMSLHLLVYGFILETIITALTGTSTNLTLQPTVGIFASPLNPIGAESILVGYFIYPNLTLTILPFLIASLSLYSIAMALIIGVLVVTNIKRALDLKSECSRLKKSTAFVAMPLIGVVGGASCCLSLPLFVSLFAPAVTLSFSYQMAYYITYFLFPPATALALKLNLSSIDKVSKKITRRNPGIVK